jgi:GWxTD domain-containing protein
MLQRALCFLLLAVSFGRVLLLHGEDSQELSGEHRKWIEQEVIYIISDQERKEFSSLTSASERDAFIDEFWRLRDPDPTTEENEYRSEHYERIRYANERFHDGIPGWKSERGRIYIKHGPPDDISFVFGGDQLRIAISNATEVLTEGAADSRGMYPVEFQRPEAEIWVYRYLPGMQSTTGNFQVIFATVDPSRLKALFQVIRKAGTGINQPYPARVARDSAILDFLRGHYVGGPYRILYAGEYRFPDLDTFYQGVFHPSQVPSFDLLGMNQAMRDLERSPGEVIMERLNRRRRLKEIVRSRVVYESFDMTLQCGTLRTGPDAVTLPITIGISPEYDSDTLELVLELVRGGIIVAHIVDIVELEPRRRPADGEVTGTFLYQTRLAARPGNYDLLVYGSLKDHSAVTFLQRKVELPDYSGGNLKISDLLLFDRVLARDQFYRLEQTAALNLLGESKPIQLKENVLIPAPDSRFRRRETLTIFFEVYNPGVVDDTQEPLLNLSCRLSKGGLPVASLPAQSLDYFTDFEARDSGLRQTSYGLSISLRSLDPGDYEFEVAVFDEVLKQKVTKEVYFTVY